MINFKKTYYYNTQNCLKTIISFCVAFSFQIAFCQDAEFTQFYSNPIYLNPALAGMDNNFRISMNKRSQWSKIPSQFNTNSISLDSWQNNTNSALSFLYSNNKLLGNK